jgi:hypothetical protein
MAFSTPCYVKKPISGLTDTNGIFIATHRDATENLEFCAEKPGYYSFMAAYHKGDYTDFSLRLHYFEDAGKTGACRSDTA